MRKIQIILIMALTIGLFQNCGQGIGDAAKLLQDGSSTLGSKSDDDDSSGQLGTRLPEPIIPKEYILADWNDPFPEGQRDADCLNNPKYNLCLFHKNPVYMNDKSPFYPPLTINTSTPAIEKKIFQIGVKVPLDGNLSNDAFTIIPPNQGPLASSGPDGSWKFQYAGDSTHKVVQIQTFYSVNRMVTLMTERSGVFYATKNNNIKINVYSMLPKFKNNAQWNGSTYEITAGFLVYNNILAGEVALDLSAIAHELGHGNLFATSKSLLSSKQTCTNYKGCFRAIHEGVADFFAAIVFSQTGPVIAEYFKNSQSGLRNISRLIDNKITALDVYNISIPNIGKGEVHFMGEVYANIWYYVYTNVGNDTEKQFIETVFSNHLSELADGDDFLTALNIIKVTIDNLSDDAKESIRYKQLFVTAYDLLGYGY